MSEYLCAEHQGPPMPSVDGCRAPLGCSSGTKICREVQLGMPRTVLPVKHAEARRQAREVTEHEMDNSRSSHASMIQTS